MAGQWKKGAIPPKWDGKAAERIVEHLEWLLVSKLMKILKHHSTGARKLYSIMLLFCFYARHTFISGSSTGNEPPC